MEKRIFGKHIIEDEAQTRLFGLELAAELAPGKIVALIGELGTGKTALTRYIAEGLGVAENVVSPTFTIVREYKSGRIPLYHFDVYRVSDPDELYEIGIEEYFGGDGVCVVEWADLIEQLLPAGSVIIRIEYGKTESERIYNVYTCD